MEEMGFEKGKCKELIEENHVFDRFDPSHVRVLKLILKL